LTDPFTDRYWIEEFQVTQADLERIVDRIRETGQAHDLTALARRVVRGRLRYGPETSAPFLVRHRHSDGAPARPAWAEDPSVRLWDPAKEWNEGDHAIVAVRFRKGDQKWFEPFVGEVTDVESHKVTVQIDALEASKAYSTQARYSEDDLQKWRQLVENLVAARRGTRDVKTQVEYVLLKHGERVVSQLLEALRADERFVRLAGRWFLRELAVPPTEEQLTALAWAMLSLEEPMSTAELVPQVAPPIAAGDPGIFGLYLGLRARPDLFENADPGKRPRWALAGPPPGSCTPRHAAYDPENYEVLCVPGQPIPSEIVRQLWSLELLKAVL